LTAIMEEIMNISWFVFSGLTLNIVGTILVAFSLKIGPDSAFRSLLISVEKGRFWAGISLLAGGFVLQILGLFL